MSKKPMNAYEDGTARTVKAQYYKNGFANYVRTDSFGATAVLEIDETDADKRG